MLPPSWGPTHTLTQGAPLTLLFLATIYDVEPPPPGPLSFETNARRTSAPSLTGLSTSLSRQGCALVCGLAALCGEVPRAIRTPRPALLQVWGHRLQLGRLPRLQPSQPQCMRCVEAVVLSGVAFLRPRGWWADADTPNERFRRMPHPGRVHAACHYSEPRSLLSTESRSVQDSVCGAALCSRKSNAHVA